MYKGVYRYTNPYLDEKIRVKFRAWWRYFSLIIIPVGMVLYSPIATFIDRLDGVSKAAGISFWNDMTEHHLVSLLFGLTFLIVFDIGFFSVERHEIVNWYRVCTAGRKKVFTPEEVDEQANAAESEWLPAMGIILAPEIIIGFTDGVRVARYEDIELLKTEICHKRVPAGFFKWEDADALQLRPSGNGINELLLAESFEDPELVQMELDIIRERCQRFHPDKDIKIQKKREIKRRK